MTVKPLTFEKFQQVYEVVIDNLTERNAGMTKQEKEYIYQLMNLDYNYCSVDINCILLNLKNVPYYKDFITCLEALCCINLKSIDLNEYGYENCKYIMEKDERLRALNK